MKKIIFLVFVFVFYAISYSQTKQQKQEITSNYNIEKLAEMSNSFSKQYQKDKKEALRLANINGWEVKFKKEGVLYELQRVTSEGKPLYYKTTNSDAAKSTRANHLHSGGVLGLNVEGQNMTAHVWDGGIARATHQEYDGSGGTNRFSDGGDGATLDSHSAHVMGTIIASGVSNQAKGMAPQAHGIGYDWNNDEAEAVSEAANGMLISNHSYGYNATDIPDWSFGAYSHESYNWDNILYNAPYYLMVVAAGNDGYNNSANGEPLEGNAYFDKLSAMSTSKNNLVIANAYDASVSSTGTLISVSINGSSSEGPTDDLRIKPDITGNGTLLYSTLDYSDTAYDQFTGTSMASPNVAGSLLLLQQHYNNVNNSFMRASTLKGLALHTADDAGINGPDAVWGWGLMNTKAAAEVISNNGLESLVIEETLYDGESYTITVLSDNVNPLLASISWTDPVATGTINNGTANDPTPVLVNDLDIRVSNGTEYEPWKLSSVTTNTQGDNIVDPFERVDITGANGIYTITVTHKGNLTNGKQDFALIVSGLGSDFTFDSLNPIVEQCAPSNALFNFDFVTATGSTGNTTFSAQNIPSGATVSFSPSTINSDGTFSMTVSDLSNVTPGEYIIDVTAQNSVESETHQVTLVVYNPSIDAPILSSPANNAVNLPYSFELDWNDDFNAQTYDIEIADDPAFSNIVISDSSTSSNYTVFNLNNNVNYYWRVRPVNMCANGPFSEVRQFTTTDVCVSYTYTGSAINIPDNASPATSTFNVSESFTLEDVNVFVDITHADVGSLLISLISPSGTSIYLTTPSASCDAQNIMATFDDAANSQIFCDEEAPIGYFGRLQPVGSLHDFDGETPIGTWTLDVKDLEPGIIGTINAWSLNVCSDNFTGVENLGLNNLNIWPNPSSGRMTISFNTSTNDVVNISLHDLSGRLISENNFTNVATSFKEDIDFGKLTQGVYIVKITNGNSIATKKILIND